MTVEVPFPLRRGPSDKRIDVDMLHAFLFKHSSPRGEVPYKGYELAEMLDVDGSTVSIIFRGMQKSNRIWKKGHKVFVADPALWRWENTAEVAAVKLTSGRNGKNGRKPDSLRSAPRGRPIKRVHRAIVPDFADI